jgi:hypothetical protein
MVSTWMGGYTRYKWWQRSDCGVWWRPVSGRAAVELWAFVVKLGMEVVLSWDDCDCRHEPGIFTQRS